MLAVALARLNAVYRAAMEEWRNSPTDTEVRVVETTRVADGSRPTKTKKSARIQSQRRNAALLARATAAARATFELKFRAAVSEAGTSGHDGGEALRPATGDLLPAIAEACEGQRGPGAASMPLGTPSIGDAADVADVGLHTVVAPEEAA
jgi:hypothetical protein